MLNAISITLLSTSMRTTFHMLCIVLNIALTLYANNIVQCNFFAGRNTIAFFFARQIQAIFQKVRNVFISCFKISNKAIYLSMFHQCDTQNSLRPSRCILTSKGEILGFRRLATNDGF